MRARIPEAADPAPTCPVCGSTVVEPEFEKRGHGVLRCLGCHVAFHPAEPSVAGLERMYSAAYFSEGGFEGYPDYLGDERVHRRQARRYLARLAELGITGGRLLDVGCAAGFFLDEARAAGWTVQGCDISDFAVAHARDRLGLDVVRGNFVDLDLGDEPFDLITMFSVLAHLPEPREVVAKLRALLRPGGHLMVETSDRAALTARLLGPRWHLCSPPSVLFFHSRRSLARLFPAPEWSLVARGRSSKWISLDHALARLEHRAPPVVASGLAALRRSRLGRLDVPYPLGDIALAVFRRSPAAPVQR